MSAEPMRILVVTRSYPAVGNLYRYPFVHRRVVAYQDAGHQVAVFQPAAAAGRHDFEGVTCRSGSALELARLAEEFGPDTVAVHGLDEAMWPVIEGVASARPVTVWLHGSEIPDFARQKAAWLPPSVERAAAFRAIDTRVCFWRDLLAAPPPGFGLVLVSNHSIDLMRRDVPLADHQVRVIHNPIDDRLFAYRAKGDDCRQRILFIRPFDSPSYGNDMAVAAIRRLVDRDPAIRITMVGDGPLFEETTAPLPDHPAIDLRRGFLTQPEIAHLHAIHGIFLVPTRLDTQGVSRDEAMSSGLVPVTNRIAAVPEFVDGSCAGLAEPDDAAGLAERIQEMIADAALFRSRSEAAAARVRRQSGLSVVIPQELAALRTAAHG